MLGGVLTGFSHLMSQLCQYLLCILLKQSTAMYSSREILFLDKGTASDKCWGQKAWVRGYLHTEAALWPKKHMKHGKKFLGRHFQSSVRDFTATSCSAWHWHCLHHTTLAFLLIPAMTPCIYSSQMILACVFRGFDQSPRPPLTWSVTF